MNKVVFFRVADPEYAAPLLQGSQTKWPGLAEDAVLVSDVTNDILRWALRIEPDANGQKVVKGDGVYIVTDRSKCEPTDIKVLEKCKTFGAEVLNVSEPLDLSRIDDPLAVGEWISTGKMPAERVDNADDDVLALVFADETEVQPATAVAPPPIPDDDDLFAVKDDASDAPAELPAVDVDIPAAPEPQIPAAVAPTPEPERAQVAAVPEPVAEVSSPETAPAEADSDDFWGNLSSQAPEVAPEVPAPPALPTLDEPAEGGAWQQDVTPDADQDIFDLSNISPPPVAVTNPDLEVTHSNLGHGRAPIEDVILSEPDAPTVAAAPPVPGDDDTALDAVPALPALPDIADEPPAEPVVTSPALSVISEAAPMRPARRAGSITDAAEILENWAASQSVPSAAAPEPKPEPTPVGRAQSLASAEDDELFAAHSAPVPDAPTPLSEEPTGPMTSAARDSEFSAKAGIPKMVMPGMRKGVSILVTGSHGGCGKTTIAYLMPYVMSHLTRQQANGKPVYLVEADYSNPKLAQRLSLRADQNSGEFAKFVRELSSGAASSMRADEVQAQTRAVIDKITYIEPSTGVRIIACPYDTTSRDTDALRDAIQKLINSLVSREDCIVFIDGQTFAKDDVLDSTLAASADAVILVGNARHVEDAQSFRYMLTTPVDRNGAGVSIDRISIFLNQTSRNRAIEEAATFVPVSVVGYLPQLEQIDDSTDTATVAWVGDALTGQALTDAVTYISQALGRFMPEDPVLTPLLTQLSDRPILGGYEKGSGGTDKKKRLFSRR